MNVLKIVTFGRSTDNNVVLSNDTVSRYHCQIIMFDNGDFNIIDLGSTNGTFVNGIRINGQTHLHRGDSVHLGNMPIQWEMYFPTPVPPSSKNIALPLVLGIVGGLLLLSTLTIVLLNIWKNKDSKGLWSFPELVESAQYWTDPNNPLYYDTAVLYVRANQSLENAFLLKNRNYKQLFDTYGLGGAKLVAEMSADACGYNVSSFYRDTQIPILPPDKLKLIPILPDGDNSPQNDTSAESDTYNIVKLIYNKKIEVGIPVCTKPTDYTNGTFVIDLPVVVIDPIPICTLEIPRGQMFETTQPNVQNIVATRTTKVTLDPYRINYVKVYLNCAAQRRGDPTGSPIRLTPFKMDGPPSAFASQQSIWRHIESKKTYPVTFYVRPRIENGKFPTKAKDFGHAFVRIPGIGLTGYGPGDGNWIGGEGNISNHDRYYRHFGNLDSCTIMVSEKQLLNITQKYNELVTEKKDYYLGHNDCTSFVMDIADAGNINYGPRLAIQTPSYFMDRLKAYNPSK